MVWYVVPPCNGATNVIHLDLNAVQRDPILLRKAALGNLKKFFFLLQKFCFTHTMGKCKMDQME